MSVTLSTPAATGQVAKLPSSFLSTQLDGELILMHGESGAFFSLTDTGLAIWNALDRSGVLGEVADILASEYEVDRLECLESVVQFSKELVDAGFAKYR